MADTSRYFDPELAARMGNLNLVARSVVEGFVAGLHRSPYKGFSLEFSEHREYVRGDDPRHIDWRAFCRSDRLYIKQYEEETSMRVHILLDASASMGYGSGNLTKLQYACYLAASLAYLMVRQQDSVGLVVFDNRIRSFLPPHATPAHFKRMLGRLDSLKASATTGISKAFHDLANHLRRRGLIIVLSDLFDGQDAVKRAIRHFRHRRQEVLVFHLLDHAELTFPFDVLSDFRDLETGARLQVDPRAIRSEYLEQMQAFVDTYRRDCAEAKIDYLAVDTSTPYDRLLLEYLSKRTRLG